MTNRTLATTLVGLAAASLSAAIAFHLAAAGQPVVAAETVIPRVPNPPLEADLRNLPGDLRAIAVPAPANLADFVKNEAVARALGKALFWDMNVGSDNVQACASCHFRAGADPRSKNQLSPGLLHVPLPQLGFSLAGVRTGSCGRPISR